MKHPGANILIAAVIITLSLFAFKAVNKTKPLILHKDLRWKSEISYGTGAVVDGYVLHNADATELVSFTSGTDENKKLAKQAAAVGNPVSRIMIPSGTEDQNKALYHFYNKKFPEAKILLTAVMTIVTGIRNSIHFTE